MKIDGTTIPPEQTPEEYAAGVQAKINAVYVKIDAKQAMQATLRADVRVLREEIAEWKALLPRKRRAKKAE